MSEVPYVLDWVFTLYGLGLIVAGIILWLPEPDGAIPFIAAGVLMLGVAGLWMVFT